MRIFLTLYINERPEEGPNTLKKSWEREMRGYSWVRIGNSETREGKFVNLNLWSRENHLPGVKRVT